MEEDKKKLKHNCFSAQASWDIWDDLAADKTNCNDFLNINILFRRFQKIANNNYITREKDPKYIIYWPHTQAGYWPKCSPSASEKYWGGAGPGSSCSRSIWGICRQWRIEEEGWGDLQFHLTVFVRGKWKQTLEDNHDNNRGSIMKTI